MRHDGVENDNKWRSAAINLLRMDFLKVGSSYFEVGVWMRKETRGGMPLTFEYWNI